jgi:hypothetical protein
MRRFVDLASKFALLFVLTGMVSSEGAVAKEIRSVPVDLRRGLDRDPGGGSNVGTGVLAQRQ